MFAKSFSISCAIENSYFCNRERCFLFYKKKGNLTIDKNHIKYMLAFGLYGLGGMKYAKRYLSRASELDVNYLEILLFNTLINKIRK